MWLMHVFMLYVGNLEIHFFELNGKGIAVLGVAGRLPLLPVPHSLLQHLLLGVHHQLYPARLAPFLIDVDWDVSPTCL